LNETLRSYSGDSKQGHWLWVIANLAIYSVAAMYPLPESCDALSAILLPVNPLILLVAIANPLGFVVFPVFWFQGIVFVAHFIALPVAYISQRRRIARTFLAISCAVLVIDFILVISQGAYVTKFVLGFVSQLLLTFQFLVLSSFEEDR
jgi:hypothetical protein